MKESDFEQENNIPTHTRRVSQRALNEDERTMLLSRSKKQEEKPVAPKKDNEKSKPWWASTFFWLLRKLIAPIIMLLMLAIGLYVGYVILADQPSNEVFKFETWKHLWDLIFADS